MPTLCFPAANVPSIRLGSNEPKMPFLLNRPWFGLEADSRKRGPELSRWRVTKLVLEQVTAAKALPAMPCRHAQLLDK